MPHKGLKEKTEHLLDKIFEELHLLGHPVRHARLHLVLESEHELVLNDSHRPNRFQKELPFGPSVRGTHG